MKKKVAVVITHPIQYYAPVFRKLSERGKVNVKVFYTWEQQAASFDKGFGREFQWDIPLLEGYDHKFVPNNGNRKKDFWSMRNPTLISEIEAWNADVVLVYGWNYRSHLNVLRYFKGKIPVFFRGDSTLLNEQPGMRTVLRRIFLKWVYSHVDYALYVGTRNRQYFEKHGLTDRQLIFVPHTVDNARFEPDNAIFQQRATEMLTAAGANDDTIKLLFVGKFQHVKDPGTLLNAFARLNSKEMRLIFVGNGELEAMLKQSAAGIDNIHFLPFQNQSVMPAVYRMGHVYCLPSISETWGLAVNEAMACKCAIVVSDKVGSAIDLVKEGNGIIFKAGNEDELLTSLHQLNNRQLLREMGNSSLRLIGEWSLEKQVAAMEAAFSNS